VDRAKESLTATDVTEAKQYIDEALKLGAAQNRDTALALQDAIKNSGDPAWALDAIVHLSDVELEAFKAWGKPPASLDLGYPILTRKAVANALASIDDVLAKRAETRKREQEAKEAESEERRKVDEAKATAEDKERRKASEARVVADYKERMKASAERRAREESSGNLAHDLLVAKSDAERNMWFTKYMKENEVPGEECDSVKLSFFQGLGVDDTLSPRAAYWNVACCNGRSFVIMVRNDAVGSSKILDCAILKLVSGVECFKKF
jgi:hypothetical protein